MQLYLVAQKAPLALGLGVVNKIFELSRVPLPIEGVTMIEGWAFATSFILLLANASPVGGGKLMMGILFPMPALAALAEFDVEPDWASAANGERVTTRASQNSDLYIQIKYLFHNNTHLDFCIPKSRY